MLYCSNNHNAESLHSATSQYFTLCPREKEFQKYDSAMCRYTKGHLEGQNKETLCVIVINCGGLLILRPLTHTKIDKSKRCPKSSKWFKYLKKCTYKELLMETEIGMLIRKHWLFLCLTTTHE